MYVGETGHIYVEKQHAAYPFVIDFLISCCEPVSRTEHVEQYRLDSSSLSAASAEGTYSMDMIRNILQHYRLDERTGQLCLDLERVSVLEAWASSQAAVDDPESYTRCLTDLSAKAEAEKTLAASVAPAASVQADGAPNDIRVKSEHKDEEGETAAAAPLPAARSRVLVLRRRPLSASVTAPQDAGSSAARIDMRTRPLVSLAAREKDWVPAPLPDAIETALREEATSAKVRIVLQPRLRRFTQGPTTTGATRGARLAPFGLPGRPVPSRNGGPGEAAGEQLQYFVVSADREQLERVLASEATQFLEPVVLHGATRWILSDVDRGVEEMQTEEASGRPATLRRLYGTGVCVPPGRAGQGKPGADTAAASRLVYKVQVKPGQLRSLKDYLYHHFGLRADCFYDHLQDPTLHVDNLRLARNVRLRPYQTASLERFQRGKKAHQGVVVLPCGAGKTLTGIGAAAILKKRTIVMCINNMSVFQWQREFLRWTNLGEDEVTVCTAKEKAMPGKVFITTYSMLVAKRSQSAKGAAARESEEILEAVRSQTWGLMLLDEVHTAVARNFQKVLDQVKYKCVLGLSATLLREDDRIDNLRHLVGPKLYEANWLDLTRAGFLARAECAEVQCPMPAAFYKRYVAGRAGEGVHDSGRRRRHGDGDEDTDSGADRSSDDETEGAGGRKRRRPQHRYGSPGGTGGINALARTTASCNPYKLWCTQALLEFHRNRSPPDKVIIFCDYLADVRFYAYHLHLPFMDQRTSESERTNLLRYFQFSDTVNALVLTRVGDVALDLPCASVIIQISGLGGSQRQEAQRLGRILRPKPPSLDNTCSYFYTLVSQGTHEVEKGYHRQRWLRDQGFACRVLRCEQVLAEYGRMGGQLCCVGPPLWWYQVQADGAPAAAASQMAPVQHMGAWWAPFSLEASARMHYHFNRGKPGCVLEGRAHLGTDTPRPPPEALGGMSLSPEESWTVTFSSADAPNTFGTVTIGEAPLSGNGDTGLPGHGAPQSRVRRITFGQLRRPHDCLAEGGPCVPYALSGLHATVDEDPTHGSEGGFGEEEEAAAAE